MDFTFSEEQAAVAESASAVFAGHATSERVAEIEAGEVCVDRELLDELGRATLIGLAVPEEHGGSGLGMVVLAILLVEQGRRVAPVPLLSTVVGGLALSRFGTEEQKAALLPGVVAGEVILAAALPTSGSGDPRLPSINAVPDGHGWVLEGVCPVVRAANLATRLLVPVRFGPGEGTGVFLVDPAEPGCNVERVITTDRQENGRVRLTGYRATLADLIGDPADQKVPAGGPGMLEWIVQRYIVGLCALQLGVCQEAVSIAARYTSERRQFGKPLAGFQGVALRAADAHIDTEAMSVTLWQAAWLLDQGIDAAAEVRVAKWWASEAGHRVVHAVQHLHGGLGADVTYPVHRYFLWGKHIELEMGAGAAQLARLGDELAGASSAGRAGGPGTLAAGASSAGRAGGPGTLAAGAA